MTPHRCKKHRDGEWAATQPMGLTGGYRCWKCRALACLAQVAWRLGW